MISPLRMPVNADIGFEPQFLLRKCITNTSGWYLSDIARSAGNVMDDALIANTPAAETTYAAYAVKGNSGGFAVDGYEALNSLGQTYIYMAIRKVDA